MYICAINFIDFKQMEIKIDGTWVGFYRYGYGNRTTNFIANLVEFENQHFEGVIEDDIATGGVPEIAVVVGSVTGTKIRFKKSYPSHSVLYQGIYEEDAEKFVGVWQIENGFGGKGTWEMRKGGIKQAEKAEIAEEIDLKMP